MGSVDRRKREQITDTTASAGSANAASIKLGELRDAIDVYYDVANNNGDIVVEVSATGDWAGEEKEVDRQASGNISSTGETDWIYGDTTYTYARAYASSAYANADINEIEISGGNSGGN